MNDTPTRTTAKEYDSVEDRLARTFERVATTTERIGIPAGTFAIGAVTIGISTYVQIAILPWLGAGLILSALCTYIWLTARSTIRIQLPPPPIPVELQEDIRWMREQLQEQNTWIRSTLERALLSSDKKPQSSFTEAATGANKTEHIS